MLHIFENAVCIGIRLVGMCVVAEIFRIAGDCGQRGFEVMRQRAGERAAIGCHVIALRVDEIGDERPEEGERCTDQHRDEGCQEIIRQEHTDDRLAISPGIKIFRVHQLPFFAVQRNIRCSDVIIRILPGVRAEVRHEFFRVNPVIVEIILNAGTAFLSGLSAPVAEILCCERACELFLQALDFGGAVLILLLTDLILLLIGFEIIPEYRIDMRGIA